MRSNEIEHGVVPINYHSLDFTVFRLHIAYCDLSIF